MPPGTVAVAESGLRTSADLVELGAAGYHAFLIGEALIRAPEPGRTLGGLLAGARPTTGEARGAARGAGGMGPWKLTTAFACSFWGNF